MPNMALILRVRAMKGQPHANALQRLFMDRASPSQTRAQSALVRAWTKDFCTQAELGRFL